MVLQEIRKFILQVENILIDHMTIKYMETVIILSFKDLMISWKKDLAEVRVKEALKDVPVLFQFLQMECLMPWSLQVPQFVQNQNFWLKKVANFQMKMLFKFQI